MSGTNTALGILARVTYRASSLMIVKSWFSANLSNSGWFTWHPVLHTSFLYACYEWLCLHREPLFHADRYKFNSQYLRMLAVGCQHHRSACTPIYWIFYSILCRTIDSTPSLVQPQFPSTYLISHFVQLLNTTHSVIRSCIHGTIFCSKGCVKYGTQTSAAIFSFLHFCMSFN